MGGEEEGKWGGWRARAQVGWVEGTRASKVGGEHVADAQLQLALVRGNPGDRGDECWALSDAESAGERTEETHTDCSQQK